VIGRFTDTWEQLENVSQAMEKVLKKALKERKSATLHALRAKFAVMVGSLSGFWDRKTRAHGRGKGIWQFHGGVTLGRPRSTGCLAQSINIFYA
jgi:hypothetical protein